jgi:hypothetical protein
MLNQIVQDPNQWIMEFVNLVRCHDGLWREPFLLAVAYSSIDNRPIARLLIQTLLGASQGADFKIRIQDILLVVECLIASKPLALGAVLEQQIATQLVQLYEQAQQDQQQSTCARIENMMCNWLLCLPEEVYRPTILIFLLTALSNAPQCTYQRVVLTILTMIANKLRSCSSIVFNELISPLLAIAGLPTVSGHSPRPTISPASDPAIANLAAYILSLLGKQGPGGLLLVSIRQHFVDHPEQFRLLARHSLESRILLTPTVVPLEEEHYQRYIDALEQWVMLLDYCQRHAITEKEIDRCLAIHHDLLTYAEEAAYPGMIYLVELLQKGEEQSDQSWRHIWQSYLAEQLHTASYILYWEIIFLWITLFPKEEDLLKLVTFIEEHANSHGTTVQQVAYRFLATLSYYYFTLRDTQSQKNFKDLIASDDLETIKGILHFLDGREPYALHYKQSLFALLNVMNQSQKRFSRTILGAQSLIEGLSKQKEQMLPDLRKVVNEQVLLTVLALYIQQDLLILRTLRVESTKNVSDFAYLVLTHELAEETAQYLAEKVITPPLKSAESIGLLLFLLEYVYQIGETNETGEEVEQKLQQIAQIACRDLDSPNHAETEVRLNIIRSLPIRSVNEFAFVVHLAEETTDERLQQACACALEQSAPQTSKEWEKLETVTQSSVAVISTAAAKRLKQKA